jgi:hypothetical protein
VTDVGPKVTPCASFAPDVISDWKSFCRQAAASVFEIWFQPFSTSLF